MSAGSGAAAPSTGWGVAPGEAAGLPEPEPEASSPAPLSTVLTVLGVAAVLVTALVVLVTRAPDDAPTVDPALATDVALFGDEVAVRRAGLRGGVVRLEGRVPSQQASDRIAGNVAGVLGTGTVVVDHVVDADAPRPSSTALFVDGGVQFASGSATIRPRSAELLALLGDVLDDVPRASVVVVGRGDDVAFGEPTGPLARARVAAVTGFLTGRGVAPDRVRGLVVDDEERLRDVDGELVAEHPPSADLVVVDLFDG